MAKFKFLGEIESIFHDLIGADGSTAVGKPGEEIEVSRVRNDAAVLHPELEAIDDEAKHLVTLAEDKARIEASRIWPEVASDADKVVEEVAPIVEADADKVEGVATDVATDAGKVAAEATKLNAEAQANLTKDAKPTT